MRRAPRSAFPVALAVLLALSAAWTAAARAVQSEPAAEAPAAAAPAGEPSAGLFFERVDVNVVNVEVWVADRRGNRVTGLAADDFEVLEDGRPVEVTNFYTVEWSDSLLATPGAAGGPGPLVVPTSPRRVPPDQQLNLMILVDNAHLFPETRRQVLETLEGFLEDRAIEGDNLMLLSYDTGLQVIQPFTHDRWAIIDAIGRLRKVAAQGPMREAQRRQAMMSISLLASASTQNPDLPEVDTAYGVVRSYIQSAMSDLRRTTTALDKAVRLLAGLPGRKAMLYVSGGLEQRPGEELFQHLETVFGAQRVRDQASQVGAVIEPAIEAIGSDQSALFNAVTRTANANQVTLYTLDATGVGGGSMLSADHSSFDIGVAEGGRVTMEAVRNHNLLEPLIELAAATGGTSILNTANFDDALTSMAADFDSYYSLGYRAPSGGDGRYHKIEVRVRRPELTLRYRTGYVDKPRAERVADRTLSSLLMGLESNPLAVSVEVGQPERRAKGRYHLPVLVRIPLAQITMLPNGEREEGRLKIFVAVKDDQGGVSDLHEHSYPVTIAKADLERALKQEIGYLAKLELRPGRPVIAVGVWDELSGAESFVQKRALVGEAARQEARRGR
jgi:VWFA-related protein